jgi:hypothetical protein
MLRLRCQRSERTLQTCRSLAISLCSASASAAARWRCVGTWTDSISQATWSGGRNPRSDS